jgi:hypothetical protein
MCICHDSVYSNYHKTKIIVKVKFKKKLTEMVAGLCSWEMAYGGQMLN